MNNPDLPASVIYCGLYFFIIVIESTGVICPLTYVKEGGGGGGGLLHLICSFMYNKHLFGRSCKCDIKEFIAMGDSAENEIS